MDSMFDDGIELKANENEQDGQRPEHKVDAYFSADVETDGPIPGPFSILSFGIVYAGCFDGTYFKRPKRYDQAFYRELRPISEEFQPEALSVNGLDRGRLCIEGEHPRNAMTEACRWIRMWRAMLVPFSLPTL